MKTKLEIIKETELAFPNEGSRAKNTKQIGSTYCYLADNGNKCAVGRYLLEPEKYLGTIGDIALKEDEDNHIFSQELFQEEYRGHDIGFWYNLQQFHDDDAHFNDAGLSESGREYLRQLYLDYAGQ